MIKEKDNTWNTFLKHIFNSIGGLKFLLKCDYKIDKLPVKLASFHKEALLAWKHNFSPTRYYIWNNKNIHYKNKSLYYEKWVENGIVSVQQLVNAEGQLLRYEEFLNKFRSPITPKEYSVVFDAIPRSVVRLIRGSSVFTTDPLTNTLFLGGNDIMKNKCSNKFIRSLLLKVTVPSAKLFWSALNGDIDWRKTWLVGDKFCLNNKIKEVSFKIMHKIHPAKKTLERFNVDIEYSCAFCGSEEETICHLFYDCTYVRIFWRDVQHYINRKTGQTIHLEGKDIFICFEEKQKEKDFIFFVQPLLFLGKFHIHKKKWTDSKPSFNHFLNELDNSSNTINGLNSKKALKTASVLDKYYKD